MFHKGLARNYTRDYRRRQAVWASDEGLLELQGFARWAAGETSHHDIADLAVSMHFFDHCDIVEDTDEETDNLGES